MHLVGGRLPALDRARRRRARARGAARGRPRPSTSPSTRRSAAARRASPRCPGRVRRTARSPGRRGSRCPPRRGARSGRRGAGATATESRSIPHTSCWCWSYAPLPMRTGRELRYPERWSSVCSVRSVSPPIPYMICRSPRAGRRVGAERLEEEREVLERLPVEAEVVQRPQHERGVADPRVAVVPVALAARRLGQRRGARGHDRAGRRVAQALQRERAALDVRPPRVVGDGRHAQPVAPVLLGGARAAPSPRPSVVGRVALPRQRQPRRLALLERRAPVACADRGCRAACCRSRSSERSPCGTVTRS